MPSPTNNFNDLNAVILLLRAIPKREGGKKEAWDGPTKMPAIIRARVFPLLIGFSSGPMSGHVNVIHGLDPAKGEVVAMEPWFPDPSKDPNFQMLSTGGGAPVFANKGTGAPFSFYGNARAATIVLLHEPPLRDGTICGGCSGLAQLSATGEVARQTRCPESIIEPIMTPAALSIGGVQR
jgi:hypothetical protein